MGHVMMDAVRLFQDRKGVSARVPFPEGQRDEMMVTYGNELVLMSQRWEKLISDPTRRWLRMHLSCEELGERMVALGEGDVEKFLDGCGDSLYVLMGDAVTYDLPLIEAFAEIHRANMTKVMMPTDPSKDRIRDKGPAFEPPNIKVVLEQHRKRPGFQSHMYDVLAKIEQTYARDTINVAGLNETQIQAVRDMVTTLRVQNS